MKDVELTIQQHKTAQKLCQQGQISRSKYNQMLERTLWCLTLSCNVYNRKVQ